jgi:hypothetical protein
MGKRGAVEAPELGMTGFSHILPAPRGMGTAYSDGFARQGASQVPIKTVNRIAYGDPADRGMLLQVWQICERENEQEQDPRVGPIFNYSSGRRNSRPKTRISPKISWRRTRAVMGGVSFGTKLEEDAEGAGMVK